jgi:sugar phosphate isomerase/epimerase
MRFAYFTVGMPEYTPEEAVGLLREAGYDGVEWRVTDQSSTPDGKPGFWAGNRCTWPLSSFVEDAPRIRALAEAAGLAMPNVGTYVTCDNLDSVELAMRGAVLLGAPQLRVNTPRYTGEAGYLKRRDQARAQYREVAELAQRYGVRALIEIHHGSMIPSASAAAAFLAGFDPRYVGTIHDAGNMVYEGHEQYRMGLELLGPYLGHVHLKNASWQQSGTRPDGSAIWRADWAPFAGGAVDMAALLATLREIGYDGWVSFEDFSIAQPTAERVRSNLAYVKGLLAS